MQENRKNIVMTFFEFQLIFVFEVVKVLKAITYPLLHVILLRQNEEITIKQAIRKI